MIPQLDVIGIIVTDMAASLTFYRHLGINFPPGCENQPHVQTTLSNGLKLALDTDSITRAFHAEWRTPPRDAGRIVIAFRCADPLHVDSVYASLVSAGYYGELDPHDAFWGHRYAIVQDPDGNRVDLYAGLDRKVSG
ncbi:VOC family protein [Nocardia sp. NPDC051929]|uniref:VOC family protein n=1 Tax=Nocardia sp. NPDC051929 TaxID=3364327 RepID=UPI0037C9A2DD